MPTLKRIGALAGTRHEPIWRGSREFFEGAPEHVGQRIHGSVALNDLPAGNDGKVYLVERHVPSRDELDGIVADYLNLAAELGRPPMARDWILEN